jgi:NitT/TauT family transport system substrate-binding protein
MTPLWLGPSGAPRINRRELLGHVAAAGAAAVVGGRLRAAAAEPPPETTRLRVHHSLSLCLAPHVGLDPRKDIAWSTHPSEESMQLLARGEIDAFMGFPPEPQRLRAKQIGHVVVNSAVDRPWAQYFCCMTIANREFVRKNPVAAKRALRAILKATDLCALEPDRAARTLVDRNITPSYDDAIQTMKDVVYTKWREYQPEDTLRFYALRLHEAGMIKTSPQKIIAQGTDWRFLNDLKKELKA